MYVPVATLMQFLQVSRFKLNVITIANNRSKSVFFTHFFILLHIFSQIMTIKINLRLCMQVFCRCMLNPSFPNQGKVMMLSLLLTILNLAKTTAQTLEIHQMSVGHGDAALVVVRDTAKVRQAIIAAGQTVPADRTDMLQLAVDSSVSLNGTVVNAVLIDGGDGSKQANKINFYMTKMGLDSLN